MKQVQGDEDLISDDQYIDQVREFDEAVSEDLNTAIALLSLDVFLNSKPADPSAVLKAVAAIDAVLGLDLLTLTREDLRVRPADAQIDETEIERQLDLREEARRNKNFPAADAIRDDLAAKDVEIMDGDPLRWEWRVTP